MADTVPVPQEIARALSELVVGQDTAVREMSIALAKKLAGLSVGNMLMIGASGTGKTTLMRAVEDYLAGRPDLAQRSTLIRVHASILAESTYGANPGGRLLVRLLEKAREQLGDGVDPRRLIERVAGGIVFIDEVDKIRARVGDRPNVDGIRAQEALLTLIENEAVPLELPDWAGGGQTVIDSSRILFVCAGAFEGLYDSVYDRVTVGSDRGSLKAVTVVEDGEMRQETRFRLDDWLRHEDLFEYGMTPQFLARFDAVVLLANLEREQLVRIFLDSPESGLRQSTRFFAAHGIDFSLSPAAVERIAAEAARHPRLGARALKEIFRRVVRDFEFDPPIEAGGVLRLDLQAVERALAPPQ